MITDMNLRILFVGFLSFIALSCSYEGSFVPEDFTDAASPDFYAVIDVQSGPDTKVFSDDQLHILWNADDRISIFNKTTDNQEYIFSGADGDNSGQFKKVSGSTDGAYLSKVYALYPYDKSTAITSFGVISFTIPAEQIYEENTFGRGANCMVSRFDGNLLKFKNIGGYLSFRLYGDDVSVSSISLRGNNGEILAGKCSIEIPGDDPVITFASSASTKSVTLTCETPVLLGGSSSESTEFWFVLPPIVFTKGFTVTVTASDGSVFEKSTNREIKIERSAINRMAAFEVKPAFTGNIVFEDANFKAYCVKNFDTDGDGEISYDESKSVKEIDVDTKDIASLKGIEHFTNLESLICSPPYSYSFVIGGWHMYDSNGNEVIGLLTSLDLSKNTKLKYLKCDVNQLTTLDLSANTNLVSLSCQYNYLKTVIVSNNPALLQMHCKYNSITGLDISSCVSLQTLDCYSNQLTNLDTSNNIALSYLSCYRNQLVDLDVSSNLKLSYLSCEKNPNLYSIWMKKGQVINEFFYDSKVSTVYYKD